MQTITVNRANFSEIFHFAEAYGVGWNKANDIFFNKIFTYRTIDSVQLSDLLYNVDEYCLGSSKDGDLDIIEAALKSLSPADIAAFSDENNVRASAICALFMIENGVVDMEVNSK